MEIAMMMDAAVTVLHLPRDARQILS